MSKIKTQETGAGKEEKEEPLPIPEPPEDDEQEDDGGTTPTIIREHTEGDIGKR